MGNLEKPLTWVLGIVFVGYLFVANCECGEGSACPLNNGFNITNADNYGNAFKFDAPTVEDFIEAVNNYSDKNKALEALQEKKDSVDVTEDTAEDGDTIVALETSAGNETDVSENGE